MSSPESVTSGCPVNFTSAGTCHTRHSLVLQQCKGVDIAMDVEHRAVLARPVVGSG